MTKRTNHRLSDKQTVRVCIDGVMLTTTMGHLRHRGGSSCMAQLAADLDGVRKVKASFGEPLPIGYGSTYPDFNDTTRNLQIDVL